MEPLTHDEWEMIDDCTAMDLIDDIKAWKTAMEKIHPKTPTEATCEHDCNDCFKKCHGYYPGEPHHSGLKDCPITIETKAFNDAFTNGTDIETNDDFIFGPEHCICKCICTDDRHIPGRYAGMAVAQ